MRKRITGILTVITSALLATGCGNTIPEMNSEQEALVVEYAAGTVLKYDKNYESRLVELTVSQDDVQETLLEEEPSVSEMEEEINESGEPEVIDNTQDVQTMVYSIEEFLGLNSVRFTYTGYEIDDFYPNDNEGEELYFIMNATEGNKLLVLKFMAENLLDSDTELNLAQSNVRFKIVVDGEEKNALTTMLLNDLAYYNGVLASGESTELVLVCEVPEEKAGGISSLSLLIKSVDNLATISLD